MNVYIIPNIVGDANKRALLIHLAQVYPDQVTVEPCYRVTTDLAHLQPLLRILSGQPEPAVIEPDPVLNVEIFEPLPEPAPVAADQHPEPAPEPETKPAVSNPNPSFPAKCCEMCGQAFWPKRSDSKYCSSKCAGKAYRAKFYSNLKTNGNETAEQAVQPEAPAEPAAQPESDPPAKPKEYIVTSTGEQMNKADLNIALRTGKLKIGENLQRQDGRRYVVVAGNGFKREIRKVQE